MKKTQARSPLPLILICFVLCVAVVGAVVFGLNRLSDYKFFRAETNSMAPAVKPGERVRTVAIKKDAPVARGEIVVMRPPVALQSGVTRQIKRIVGLPGETISAVNGKVEINGQPLAEPYLAAGTVTTDFPAVHLGPNSYFVLGDNRANSADSRFFGPVPAADIMYRVTRKQSLL